MDSVLNGQCASPSVGPANQLFGLLVQTILAAQCTISPPDMWPKDYGPTALAQGLDEYDFVIVGAGSAGSVMASRLTENPKCKVLLLEAGGDPPIESELPFLFLTLQHTPYDWQFYARSRKARACRASPKGCYWPRGKMLGGSGAMNAMVYMRGNARDYDGWEARGNPGWGWKSALRYFRKSEDNRDPQIVRDGKYHGTGGYLSVVTSKGDSAGMQRMLQAAEEAGYPVLTDFNANKHIGFGPMQRTIVNETRCSPAKAFLVPAKQRPNLQVIKSVLVTKILFDHSKRAAAIQFTMSNGKMRSVKVKREVIVSAGVVNTPKLLMLSGIGQEKQLRAHNIPVVSDLPVGRKLQDHVTVPVIFKLNRNVAPNSSLPKDTFEYLVHRAGPLTEPGLTGLVGFVNSLDPHDPYPNVQYHHFYSPVRSGNVNSFLAAAEVNETVGRVPAIANAETDLIMVLSVLIKPKSWGSVKLQSSNPQDEPKIEAGYLYHQDDVRALIGAIRVQQKIMSTRAAAAFQPELLKLDLPACERFPYDSDAYWECYAREVSFSLYHAVGTAKMGPDGDPDAVVDSRLRVRGVRGLRVVDSSVMPEIVSGNTNAPTIMIAEKASDMVKEDYRGNL
ncbi:AGAP003785-PE-like protein [Anopheles sinensis]|uniref:AGAP003785-PE-like protein n=1 Tax=Anopheles sinensis TaxID=74873 RepID=A0A084VW93_ANOSI|nr:AGAP003785-PE-like protein [Anopheles sinensis]